PRPSPLLQRSLCCHLPARRIHTCSEPRGGQQPANGSVLAARHPTSHHGNLTDQQGHDLTLRLKARLSSVLTCWRLGDQSLRGGRSPLAVLPTDVVDTKY